MTRDMSLTLLLMVTSIAAAVAAPGADDTAAALDCMQTVAAGPVLAGHPPPRMAKAVPVVLPATGRADVAPAASPCAADAGATYRHWHHGSLKLNLGCAALTDS